MKEMGKKPILAGFERTMVTLAVDTSEYRGSIALRRDGKTVAMRLHEAADYSSWLLPAARGVLREAGVSMESLDLLAVATGPGSFTGVRVGLTTVKAWAEVYGKRVVGVSRLQAMTRLGEQAGLVATSYDAQRGQIFGGLYRWVGREAIPLDGEAVVAPDAFVAFVESRARQDSVQWISLDPEVISSTEQWGVRKQRGDQMVTCRADIASLIGEIGEERAWRGEFTPVSELDANYVRRSDAEILWKGPASGVR